MTGTALDKTISRDERNSGRAAYVEGVQSIPPNGSAVVQTPGPPADAVAPVLSTLAPSTIVHGTAPVKVTVTGTGFVPASRVLVNGVEQLTGYVSATQLTYWAQATSAGTQPVTVRDAATSNALTMTVT